MNAYQYTTVQDLRSEYLNAQQTTDDALLLKLIKTTSKEINDVTNRWFVPIIQTRYFDTPEWGAPLLFDADLLESTALTNGDGTSIAGSDCKYYPLNETPKSKVVVLPSSSSQWLPDASGNADGAISQAGVWGYHGDYSSAWEDIGLILSASTGSASGSIAATGTLYAGQFLKIGSEYLLVTSSGSTPTVTRAVNGATAASHSASAPVYSWDFGEVGQLCKMAAAAYYRLRANPLGDTISIDGMTFATPKDVKAYLDQALGDIGLVKLVAG